MTDSEKQISGDAFEALVRALAERFSNPTPEMPALQCASRSTLIHALSEVRKACLDGGLRKSSSKSLFSHMEKAGLFQLLPVTQVRTGSSFEVFSVGFGVDADEIAPPEILMALVPKGVICYFSAIYLHGLSTQEPPFHHVAELKAVQKSAIEAPLEKVAPLVVPGKARNPLGKHILTYQGLSYYITSRSSSLIAATQSMYEGGRSLVRLTSKEQTLLDALMRPMSCGGPSVIFEVWETGAGLVDVNELVRLVGMIGDSRLARRAGYMIENYFGKGESAGVHKLLNSDVFKGADLSSPISLLPTVPYRNVSDRWHLLVP